MQPPCVLIIPGTDPNSSVCIHSHTNTTFPIQHICFLCKQTICHHGHKMTPDHLLLYALNAAGWEEGLQLMESRTPTVFSDSSQGVIWPAAACCLTYHTEQMTSCPDTHTHITVRLIFSCLFSCHKRKFYHTMRKDFHQIGFLLVTFFCYSAAIGNKRLL